MAAEKTGQAAEIVKQVLDKIAEGAKAAQTTVEAALPHVVKAYAARQVGYFLAAALLAVFGVMLFRLALKHPMVTGEGSETTPTVYIFLAIVGGICAVFGLGTAVGNLGATLGVLADPTGMFILDLISK